MRIAVVVCSTGRPAALGGLVQTLARQTRAPDRVLFVVVSPEDAPGVEAALGGSPGAPGGVRIEVALSAKGLPRQRNRGLDLLGDDCDVVLFLDDDYVPVRTALAGVEDAFRRWPDVNGMTGRLIADGIRGPGIGVDEALGMVRRDEEAHEALASERGGPAILADLAGLYGCNMAYRVSAIGDRRFDEALPLYGWQEDVDFAARVPGRRIRTDAFAGVHRGDKSGRDTAGRRLGYSQIANPFYLVRKGSMAPSFALRLVVRNIIANHLRALRPEPWIHRRDRARGNWLAIADILRGRSRPGRILDL